MTNYAVPTLVFLLAALLEVGGDAAMRRQVKGHGWIWAVAGFAALAFYGWVVNHVPWRFSNLLGAYVAVFAWVGVLWGKFVDGDRVGAFTWAGLIVITAGGAIIQAGALRGSA